MYNLLLIKNQELLIRLTNLLGENKNEVEVVTLEQLITQLEQHSRRRLIVKKVNEFIALRMEEVVLFYTKNKLVYTLDQAGRKYYTDKNLGDLEKELDDNLFFRANRQYIINLNFIRGYKPYEKVKLMVDLTLPDPSHQVIISQETAPVFRQWMLRA